MNKKEELIAKIEDLKDSIRSKKDTPKNIFYNPFSSEIATLGNLLKLLDTIEDDNTEQLTIIQDMFTNTIYSTTRKMKTNPIEKS